MLYHLVIKEGFLGNSVDCILKGIQNEAQANSEPYRELVRNTCGMFGVPPNYMPISYGNHSLFMRIPEVYVGKNHENSTNGTFRINHENETYGGPPDYSSIQREEELHRKPLVLSLAFLVLLHLLIVEKVIVVLEILPKKVVSFISLKLIFSLTSISRILFISTLAPLSL